MRETLKRIFRFAIPVIGPERGRGRAVVRSLGLPAAALALCLASPAGALAGPNDTDAGVVTARSEGTTSLIVTMPYKGDADGDNSAKVEYKLCSDTAYTTVNATHSASPYVVTLGSLTANTCYDIRATYNETSPDVVTGTNPQLLRISTTWDTTMLHNRNRFPGSTKWDANSGWGMPGTKYGQFTCETCHTSPTANIKRIKETITAPNAPTDTFPGSTVLFQSVTTPNGFGDDTGGHTTSTKVCEVCHSQNSVHNYNTTGQSDLGHNNNVDCTQCHPHNLGFVGGGACDTCHGAPPGTGTDTNAPAVYAASHTKHYDRTAGGLITSYTSTSFRSSSSAYVFDCGTCHSNSSADHTANVDGTVDVKLPIGGTFTAGSYTGGDNTPPPGSVTFKNSDGTCSTVYCHGNFTGGSGGTGANAPKWGGTISCSTNTCHGASESAAPAGGSHGSHVATASGIKLDCSKCHNGIASIGTVSDKSKHVNRAADWSLAQNDDRINDTIYGISGTYSDSKTGSKTPPSSTYGNCSNIYCHSIVQTSSGAALTGAANEYASPTWGTGSTGQCGTCHKADGAQGNATTMDSGKHTAHLGSPYAYPCGRCHNGAGDASTKHADRQIDAGFSLPYNYAGTTPAYSGGTTNGNHAPGGGYGSCSNVYCHSIVQTSTGGALTASTADYKTPAWSDGALACSGCHGNPPDSATHAKHGPTCTSCHTAATASTHAGGAINMVAGISYTQGNANTPGDGLYGSCTTSCHSDGRYIWTTLSASNATPVWGSDTPGVSNCAACHGNGTYLSDYRKATPLYASTTSQNPGKPNAHRLHTTFNTVNAGETQCKHCHYQTTTDNTTITASGTHGNNAYTVTTTGDAANTYPDGDDVSASTQVAMTYNGGNTYPSVNTCSSVSCHPSGTTTASNTSTTVPWEDLSTSGYQCADCHSINLTSGTTYHHSMNTETYTPNSTSGYPTTVPQGDWSGGTNAASRTCLMCHVKHNLFSNRLNTNAALTAPRAMNLRTDIATSPTASAGFAASDYDSGTSPYGICISCHTNALNKDTGRQLSETASTQTPAVTNTDYAGSSHQYGVSATMKTGGATFAANCSKCHTAKNGEGTTTFASRALGTHDSPVRRLLAVLGITAPTDPLEENFCYRCHSRSTETGNLANPGGGPAKATANADYYGVQPGGAAMSATSQLIWRDFRTVFGSVAAGSTTTVVNVSGTTGWTSNQWVGYSFTITSGTLAGQSRRITANTTTSVTVTAAFASAPAASVTYQIGGFHNLTLRSGSHKPIEAAAVDWMDGTAGKERHVECEDCHNPHAARADKSDTSGTVASSTATTLVANGTPNWPTDRWKGYIVNIKTTGRGQARYIASNSSNTLTIVGNWSTNPAANDAFAITSTVWVDGGSATSGTANTIADTSKAWTNNQWAGYYVQTVSGTGPAQVRLISSNTNTTITVSANWTTNPAASTGYVIYRPPMIAGVNSGLTNVVNAAIVTQNAVLGTGGSTTNMRGTTYTAKSAAAATQYELCLKCHSTWAYNSEAAADTPSVPSSYPSALNNWGATVEETDIGKDFDVDNYAYHPLFAPGRHQPIRMGNAQAAALGQSIAYNANWPNYTTGTVSVTSGSAAVTGSGTTFPAGVGAGYWIHIGSATPTNPTTTGIGGGGQGWWPVAARNSTTSLTLAVPFGGTGGSYSYRITKGFKSTFVDGWGPESLVTCTDCHNTSTATTARGPHGSANRWLLRNQVSQTVTDINGTVTAYDAVTNPLNFCLNCHSRFTYYDATIGGTRATPTTTHATFGRMNHATEPNGQCYTNGASNGNHYAIPCLNCHGGSTAAGTPGPGQIHGSNLGTGTYGTSPRGFRFMNGASWNGHTTPYSGTGACYTLSATNSLSTCTDHAGPTGNDTYAVTYSY